MSGADRCLRGKPGQAESCSQEYPAAVNLARKDWGTEHRIHSSKATRDEPEETMPEC